MSSIFGNEESISVKLFNLLLKAAFTSYSPLRLPPPRLYHCCWTGHKPHTRRWCAWDYSQDRIAQETLTSNWIWLNPFALAAHGGCMLFIQSGWYHRSPVVSVALHPEANPGI